MADAVTTNNFRARMATHFLNNSSLPAFGSMVFGDGGYKADLTAKTIDPAQTALNHPLLTKTLTSVYQEDAYSVTGKGTLEKTELIGAYISEAGLVDSAGNLLGLRNFAPKIKENDEIYEIEIKLKF